MNEVTNEISVVVFWVTTQCSLISGIKYRAFLPLFLRVQQVHRKDSLIRCQIPRQLSCPGQ